MTRRNVRLLAVLPAAAAAVIAVVAASAATARPARLAKDPTLGALLPAEIRSRGTIKVATDIGYAPFEYFGPSGRKPVGLDVDLMRALEPILGVKFDISDTTYAGIIPALQAKRYDVGWSAIAIHSLGGTKTVDFLVYINPSLDSLLVSASNTSIKKPLDVCGKTLGWLQAEKAEAVDAANANCKKAGKPQIKWKFFQKVPDVLLAVESGQVDARVAHVVNGDYYVKASKSKLKLLPRILPSRPLTMGIAVPVDQKGLEKAIQGGMQELIANGTYARILARYGATSVGVRRITVRQQ